MISQIIFFSWVQTWDVLILLEQVSTLQRKFYIEKSISYSIFSSCPGGVFQHLQNTWLSLFALMSSQRVSAVSAKTLRASCFAGSHIRAILKPPPPYWVSSFSKPYPSILNPQSLPWLNHITTISIVSRLSLILKCVLIIDKALM